MQHRSDWDHYWMSITKITSSRSTCLSRHVGAILVKNNQILSSGYNGALPGQRHCCDDPNGCYRRYMNISDSNKYDLCKASHAEANAIALAAKSGICVDGSTLYCTLSPCFTCSKVIIMAGVKRVVVEMLYESPNKQRDEMWLQFLKENDIDFKTLNLEGCLEDLVTSLNNGTSNRKI